MNKVVFIQKRANRGGAQVALSRLMTAQALRELSPLVVLGAEGWLADELRTQSIDVFVTGVPSVRSLSARLWGNRAFVRRVAARVEKPLAVIANNHQEAMLAAELGRATGARSAVILRDSYLTKDVLEKYGWDEPDHTLAVGGTLASLAEGCNASVPVTTINDSITPSDFMPPKSSTSPQKILVVGGSDQRKGWSDWIEAVEAAKKIMPEVGNLQFDFTGKADLSAVGNYRFLDKTNNFRDLVRSYDLVIHPSRSEAFGLAAVEAVAAGVPVLTTRTGIFANGLRYPEYLSMEAGEAEAMGQKFAALLKSWDQVQPAFADAQSSVKRFTPEAAAASVIDCIERMQRGE